MSQLKHDEEAKAHLDRAMKDLNRGYSVSDVGREFRRSNKVKPILRKPKAESVRTAELQADDDPKPKLYRIDWEDEAHDKGHRYVAAIDKTIALTLFDKKWGHAIDAIQISVNRVPSEWSVRFPVLWDRIGIEIADTHKEQVAKARAQEKADHAKYKEWHKGWVLFWKTLADAQEDDMKMYVELRKVKYEEWLNDWLEMWADIGETKYENRSRFDYIEI